MSDPMNPENPGRKNQREHGDEEMYDLQDPRITEEHANADGEDADTQHTRREERPGRDESEEPDPDLAM